MGEYINDITIYDDMKKMYRNDDMYCNCYFMLLLNITKAFGKNEHEIILNADLTYDLFEKNDSGYPGFRLKVETFVEMNELLKHMGIGLSSNKIEAVNVIDSMKEYINQGNLILLSIDLFYQKNKVYYFQKQHGEHTVLVYGYSDEKQCLYLIDNINKGYEKYTVSYEEVAEYIEGLCNYCGYGRYSNYFIRFYKDGEKGRHSDADIIDRFFADISKKKSAYGTALQCILEFKARLNEMCTYPSFEENLLTMKYRKASLCFRNRLVLDQRFRKNDRYETLVSNQDEVLKAWTQIRTYYIYMKRKNAAIEDISTDLSDMLLSIYQKETYFYEIFLDLTEKVKKQPVNISEKVNKL